MSTGSDKICESYKIQKTMEDEEFLSVSMRAYLRNYEPWKTNISESFT